jgi:hypothetical protein
VFFFSQQISISQNQSARNHPTNRVIVGKEVNSALYNAKHPCPYVARISDGTRCYFLAVIETNIISFRGGSSGGAGGAQAPPTAAATMEPLLIFIGMKETEEEL